MDKQTAIDLLDNLLGMVEDNHESDYDTAIKMGIDAIKALPSVQPPRWIPVSEALPDRGKTVLITNDKGNVRCGRFRGVEFWKDDGDAYWTFKGNTVEHVLAWMALPEPWGWRQDEDDRR